MFNFLLGFYMSISSYKNQMSNARKTAPPPSVCAFCLGGPELNAKCGELMTSTEINAHLKCMQYNSGLTQYQEDFGFGGFHVDEVLESYYTSQKRSCFKCKNVTAKKRICPKNTGATAGCPIPSCRRSFHFPCAPLHEPIKKKTRRGKSLDGYLVWCSQEHKDKDLAKVKFAESSDDEEEDEAEKKERDEGRKKKRRRRKSSKSVGRQADSSVEDERGTVSFSNPRAKKRRIQSGSQGSKDEDSFEIITALAENVVEDTADDGIWAEDGGVENEDADKENEVAFEKNGVISADAAGNDETTEDNELDISEDQNPINNANPERNRMEANSIPNFDHPPVTTSSSPVVRFSNEGYFTKIKPRSENAKNSNTFACLTTKIHPEVEKTIRASFQEVGEGRVVLWPHCLPTNLWIEEHLLLYHLLTFLRKLHDCVKAGNINQEAVNIFRTYLFCNVKPTEVEGYKKVHSLNEDVDMRVELTKNYVKKIKFFAESMSKSFGMKFVDYPSCDAFAVFIEINADLDPSGENTRRLTVSPHVRGVADHFPAVSSLDPDVASREVETLLNFVFLLTRAYSVNFRAVPSDELFRAKDQNIAIDSFVRKLSRRVATLRHPASASLVVARPTSDLVRDFKKFARAVLSDFLRSMSPPQSKNESQRVAIFVTPSHLAGKLVLRPTDFADLFPENVKAEYFTAFPAEEQSSTMALSTILLVKIVLQ